MTGLLSVIVPVYNSEKYLDDCLASIRKSTNQNIEVILVDDGSTDSSAYICDLYASQDHRFRSIHIKNKGVSYARNVGISHSTGEYLTFVDSDDLVEPTHFDNILIREDEDFVCSGYKNVTEGIIKRENTPDAMLLNIEDVKKNLNELWGKLPITFVWCACYKRNLIVSNNLKFDESISLGEDTLFNIDYLKVCRKIRISSSSGYWHSCVEDSLVHQYYPERAKKEEKECRALEELSERAEYRLRWFTWHVALKHYEIWLNKKSISVSEVKYKMKMCYNNLYFRESIPYIRKNGSLDEKIESYFMGNHMHKIFKLLWKVISKISNR